MALSFRDGFLLTGNDCLRRSCSGQMENGFTQSLFLGDRLIREKIAEARSGHLRFVNRGERPSQIFLSNDCRADVGIARSCCTWQMLSLRRLQNCEMIRSGAPDGGA
jgi:hypothetical protein